MTMTSAELTAAADEHLWLHFSRLSREGEALTVIERGDGAYVWDSDGRRYLDGLAGLFVVQAGHGREEMAEAAATQSRKLAYFPLWTYAHPAAVELAARIAQLAPGDLNRVFFTTGGSEAVESAWKLARQYHLLTGQTQRYKVIARQTAYHGTTLGALTINGVESLREPFRPMMNTAAARHVRNTNRLHCELCRAQAECTLGCADEIEAAIIAEGPDTVAAVFLEPVQNAGGCFVPAPGYWQRVREICDRHGVLLVSDEVICAFGRLGTWFGAQKYGYQPDMITFAKGATSGYAPLGGVIVRDRIAEPFRDGTTSFLHGITFGGHPVSCAVALANIDVMEREDLTGRVQKYEAEFRSMLESLTDLPLVAEVRGTGYFYAVELTNSGQAFDAAECEWLIRNFLSHRLLELGLICRTDDRGDPVIQFSPPLVAGPEEFDFIGSTLRQVLVEAWKELEAGAAR